MILAAGVGLALQLLLGWRDAVVFGLLIGLVAAQLVPPGKQSCSLPPRTERD